LKSKIDYLKRIISSYILNYKTSNLAFWHSSLRANDLTDTDLKTLRAYPQNYESKVGLIDTTDNSGVIMLDYKGELGLQYNPNAIAQLALGYFDKILYDQDYEKEFLTLSSYFIDHGRLVEDDILLWEYNFPFEMRNYLNSPWRSALAQGQGLSVCLRAYKLSKDEKYLDVAKKAFKSFYYLAKEHPGGVLDNWDGHTWLEEYIVTPPNHVLNGFIWALWGVRDYAVFFNHDYAWELWKSCVKALKANLHRYDIGFWTCYDIKSGNQPVMPCSLYYQTLHVIQMKAMYNLTGKEIFNKYDQKWSKQLEQPINRIISQAWKAFFKVRWF